MVRSLHLKSLEHSQRAGRSITSPPRQDILNRMARCKMLSRLKRLFEKCKESGVSKFQALLDWRNTPTEGMATSPAQRLMGRRCRTLLPMSESLLWPSYSLRDDVRAMSDKKRRLKINTMIDMQSHFLASVLFFCSLLYLHLQYYCTTLF